MNLKDLKQYPCFIVQNFGHFCRTYKVDAGGVSTLKTFQGIQAETKAVSYCKRVAKQFGVEPVIVLK